jgi:hypothetical protein
MSVKRKSNYRRTFQRILIFSIVVSMPFIWGLGYPGQIFGYVLPAEQLVQLMAENASKFKTLVITQLTQQEKESAFGGKEIEVFREQIWMQAPARYRSKVLNEGLERREAPNTAFRRLLLANSPESFMKLLLEMGINLDQVAYTRVDGIVAYRIGNAEPGTPKLVIEKERFLPLQLTYWAIGDNAGALVDVRFKDYREVDHGWYPFEITYSSDRWPNETYTLLTILPNGPFDPSVFSMPMSDLSEGKTPEKGEGLSNEERLKQIIRKFEKKYH